MVRAHITWSLMVSISPSTPRGLLAFRPRRFGVPALASVVIALQLGCTMLPLGGSPTGRPGGYASPMGRDLKVYRIAAHCHSHLSHDSEVSFEAIAAACRHVGLNGAILSDHYEPGNISRAPPEFIDGVLFIPGVELRAMGGSLLAFGIHQDFDEDRPPAELAAQFRNQGGLTAAGHCERIDQWGTVPVDGFEVYNLHAEFQLKHPLAIAWRFLLLLRDTFFETSIETPSENLRTWDHRLLAGDRLFPILGCDAHENVRVFGPLGGLVGTYPEMIRLFSNHVLASELSERHIMQAISRGHVYGVFDHLGDAAGFSMTYGPPHPGAAPAAILGDRVPFDPDWTLKIDAPREATIRIIKDGQVAHHTTGTRWREPLLGPGVCRVELYRRNKLWIVSSPLYVEAAP